LYERGTQRSHRGNVTWRPYCSVAGARGFRCSKKMPVSRSAEMATPSP